MHFYVTRCPSNLGLFPWLVPENLSLCIDGETPVDNLREYIGAMWRVDPACVSFYIGDEADGINSSTMAGKCLADVRVTGDDETLYVTARLGIAQWSTRTLHMRDVVRRGDGDEQDQHVVRHYVDPALCWACGKSTEDTSGCLELLCGHTHCSACADALERDAAAITGAQAVPQRGFFNDPSFYCCRYCMLPTLARGLQRARSTSHLDAHKAGRRCNVRDCGGIATQACWCETVFCDRHAREHSDRIMDHTTAPLAERGAFAFVPGLCHSQEVLHGGIDDLICKGRLRYYCMTYHEAMCAHCGYSEKHASCGAGCHVRLDDPRAVADRETTARKAWTTVQSPLTDDECPTEQDSSAAALARLVTYRDRLLQHASQLVASVQSGHLPRPFTPKGMTTTRQQHRSWALCHGSIPSRDADHSLCVKFMASCIPDEANTLLRQAATGQHACCVGLALTVGKSKVKWVDAWGVNDLTDASLCEVATHCPQLQHLNVSWCKQLTDASICEVATHCPQLQHLNVSWCNRLTDASIREVATHCPQLQHLNVYGCNQLTDASIREVATHCPQLQHLNVSWCNRLTDASIREVATHCPQLQHLDVEGCNQLTDASIREVATHCPQLRHLNVTWCQQLTDASIREVATHCPQLQYLYVYGCNQLTDASIREVATHCRSCSTWTSMGARN